MKLLRLFTIQRVLARYGLDDLLAGMPGARLLRVLFCCSPSRWINPHTRKLPRAERIRRALEELGPIFVKFGQVVSTRRDLLPDAIAQRARNNGARVLRWKRRHPQALPQQ